MARGNGDIWLKEPRKPRTNFEPKLVPTYFQRYQEMTEEAAAAQLAAYEERQAARNGATQQLAV